jgi:hypothetical protein
LRCWCRVRCCWRGTFLDTSSRLVSNLLIQSSNQTALNVYTGE